MTTTNQELVERVEKLEKAVGELHAQYTPPKPSSKDSDSDTKTAKSSK